LSSTEKTGRIRINVFGQDHAATWRVIGNEIEITSSFGVARASLGGLSSAPATAAQEKFRDMVKEISRPQKKSLSDRARFNVRDA